MIPTRRRLVVAGLALVLLAACDPSADRQQLQADQQYLFLESLKQVEAGGRKLRDGELRREDLERALTMMDDGLKMAFQVKREFLDELDLRLGKNFERYFIRGVEYYRIGIEAGDESQQREGLALLGKWSEFWSAEKTSILARLQPE